MRNWSPLTAEVHHTSAHGWSSRRGETPRHILVHATGGGTVQGNLDRFVDGSIVSCNYYVAAARVFGIVPEPLRAHTSGSSADAGRGAQWDRESITIECRNYRGRDGWTVEPADYAALVALVDELAEWLDIPLDAGHIIGHRELWTRHRASYPTECPAGVSMPAFIDDVRAHRAARDPEKESDMLRLIRNTKTKEVHLLNLLTGRSWHLPNDAYRHLWEHRGWAEKLQELPDNEFRHLLQITAAIGAADATIEPKIDKLARA